MKRILFGITSLTLGGAERVLVDLANKLSSDYEITIYTIYDNGELKKQLNQKVQVISLYEKPRNEYNKLEKLKISLKLLFIDRVPVGYDTYVAFLEGPITRLFAKRIQRNIKRIAWIHNDISLVFGNNLKSKIKKVYDKKIYSKYDKLIFVSDENKNDFNKLYGNEFDEEVIRNYLDYKKVIEKADKKEEVPFNKNDINFLTVCRLVDQKALDRFIKIHAKLEKEGIHSKVYIVGDGPLRYKLQNQIDELNETENFYLLGARQNPYPYIKETDYFCLLSYYEGYGMALEEAKILNKEIIITDTAARESLKGYKKGIILDNNEKSIYEGLKKVLTKEIKTDSLNEKYKNTETTEQYYNNIIKEIKRILEGQK